MSTWERDCLAMKANYGTSVNSIPRDARFLNIIKGIRTLLPHGVHL